MKRIDLLKGLEIEGVKLTVAQKEDYIKQYEEAIAQAVAKGEKVKTGLGTFSKKHKEARRIAGRTMIHPATKQEIVIPEGMTEAKDVLGFKTNIEF